MFLKPEEIDQKTMTLSSSIYRSQDLHGSLYKRTYNSSTYTPNFGQVLESTYKLLDDMRDNFKLNIGRPYGLNGLSGLKSSAASYTSSVHRSTSNLRSEYRSEGLFSSYELKRTQYFPKRDTKEIIKESQNLIADIRASLQASKAELALYEDPADLKASQKSSKKVLIAKSPSSNIKIEENKEIEKPYNVQQHYILEGNAHRKIAHNLKKSDDQALQPSSMTFNDALHSYMPRSPEAEKKVTVLSPRSPSEENQQPMPVMSFGPQDRLAQAIKPSNLKISTGASRNKEIREDYGKENENYEERVVERITPKQKTVKNQRGIHLLQNAIKEANAYMDDPNQLVEVSELKSEFNNSEFLREQEDGDKNRYMLRTNLSNNQEQGLDSALNFDESPKPDIPLMFAPEPQAKVSLKIVPSKSKSKENRPNPFKNFEGFRTSQTKSQMKDGNNVNKGNKKEGLSEKNRNFQSGKSNGLFRSVQK